MIYMYLNDENLDSSIFIYQEEAVGDQIFHFTVTGRSKFSTVGGNR